MNDRPTAPELVQAVRTFLEAEVVPALTDARLRFQALVAANVLSIVGRELSSEEEVLRAEAALLGLSPPERLGELRRAVAEANASLCARIRAGEFDEPGPFRELAVKVRQTVVAKLMVANPRYLAAVEAERAGLPPRGPANTG